MVCSPLSEVLRKEHGLGAVVVVWKAIGADYKLETTLDHIISNR